MTQASLQFTSTTAFFHLTELPKLHCQQMSPYAVTNKRQFFHNCLTLNLTFFFHPSLRIGSLLWFMQPGLLGLVHSIPELHNVTDFCLVPHYNNGVGLVSASSDGVLKYIAIGTAVYALKIPLTWDRDLNGMEVETEFSDSFSTLVVMTLGSYHFPINTVDSLTHPSLPLTVIAFGGLTSSVHVIARCTCTKLRFLSVQGTPLHHCGFPSSTSPFLNQFVPWS